MKLQYLAVVVVVGLFSGFSHADSIYEISGHLSITGNNACGGALCNETINFSLELDNGDFLLHIAPFVVPGTAEISAVGPLGSFPIIGVLNQRMAFVNGVTEIDIDRTVESFLDPFGPPSFVQSAYIYWCFTATCAQDFSLFPNEPLPQAGVLVGGPAEVDVTLVPEGSELAMLAITAVGILGAFKKRVSVAR